MVVVIMLVVVTTAAFVVVTTAAFVVVTTAAFVVVMRPCGKQQTLHLFDRLRSDLAQ